MYESPIKLYEAMEMAKENEIYKAIQKVGVTVDKDELVRALEYDREQYYKGFKDGKEAICEWVSVKDRLPKDYISVIGHMTNADPFPSVRECYYIGKGFYFPALKDFEPVDYWQEMPEPPKGE